MPILGIALDSETMLIAKINKKKDILKLSSSKTNGSSDVNPLDISKNKRNTISTGLDSLDVLIKNTPFNVKKSFFLKKAFKFQEEIVTTIDPSLSITAAIYLQKQATLKFFITTKDFLKKHLCRFKHFGLDPDHVSANSLALCKFARYYSSSRKNALIVHIEQNKTTIILMKDFMPVNSHVIKIGSKKLKTRIKDNLDSNLTELNEGINKLILACVSKSKEKYPYHLTGDIYELEKTEDFFKSPNISSKLANEALDNKHPQIKNYAISIGLALDAIDDEKCSIQFRQDKFISEKKLLNVAKSTILFSIFTILLAAGIFFNSKTYLDNKEKKLLDRLSRLEKLEEKKFSKTSKSHSTFFFQELEFFEKKINREVRVFPYFMKAYKVSDVLHWLNSHPNLKEVEVTSIKYELEKYPTLYSKKQKHLTKVEVEFQTDSLTVARSFYNSLMKSASFVDSNREITWDINRDKYTTSFYLKNKKI